MRFQSHLHHTSHEEESSTYEYGESTKYLEVQEAGPGLRTDPEPHRRREAVLVFLEDPSIPLAF